MVDRLAEAPLARGVVAELRRAVFFFRLHHVWSGVFANCFSCAAEVGEPHLGILSR